VGSRSRSRQPQPVLAVTPDDTLLFALAAGLLGLLFGSFLNVCSLRWPMDESVVKPRSRCPGCAREIAWYDNVPVASWLLLRGRCRGCAEPISIRYPLTELATALAWGGMVAVHGPTYEALRGALLLTLLLGIALSDARFYLIPDQFTIGGAALMLILSALTPAISPGEALLGAVVGFGGFWLLGQAADAYYHRFRQDALREALEEHEANRGSMGTGKRLPALRTPAFAAFVVAAAAAIGGAGAAGALSPVTAVLLAGLVVASGAVLAAWIDGIFAPTTFDEELEEGALGSALGGGDIKMMALVGAALGWTGVALTVFGGALFAVVASVAVRVAGGQQLIPFGIFLALGAVVAYVFGDPVVAWYLDYAFGGQAR
jgi:prepilin signal peptidase PulO-like enzyme (type II secretory pathway)